MKPEMKKLIIANLPYLLFVYLFGKLGQTYRLAAGRTCRKSYCTLRTAFPLPLKAPPPASTCSIWRWAWPVRWHCG